MVYKLFACCFPVKGFRRSIIVDTQRKNYHVIPNGLYEILTRYEYYSLEKIKEEIGFEFKDIIDEYFTFLCENELIFSCNKEEVHRFPKISLEWNEPHHIMNSIIDVNESSQHNFESIFGELSDLLCKNLEIRFFRKINTEYLDSILKYTENKSFQSIDIIIPYNDSISVKKLNNTLLKYPRLINLIIYNSPNIEKIELEDINDGQIYFIKNKLEDCTSVMSIIKCRIKSL